METVSPSMVAPAQTKSRRLAAKACRAACVRMAIHRERWDASAALRRMSGLRAGRRRKVVVSGLHRPPFDSEDNELAPSGTEKLWVC